MREKTYQKTQQKTLSRARLNKLRNAYRAVEELLVNNKIDPELIGIIAEAFTRNLHARLTQAITQTQASYWHRLFAELSAMLQGTPTLVESSTVEGILLTFNFNYRLFCLRYISILSKQIDAEDSTEEKLDKLSLELKKINQLQCEPGLSYLPGYVSVKEFIGNWIGEEIAYLEKKRLLDRGIISTGEHAAGNYKLNIDMSVAQLTCLIRGLVERKVILSNNLTELSGFLSRVIITKRAETFSEGSFRRKYYNIEDNTKRTVIEMLKGTMDWLTRN